MKVKMKRYLFFLMLFLVKQTDGSPVLNQVPNSVVGIIYNPDSAFVSPRAVAFTPDGTKAYIGNYFGSNVSVVDVATNRATETVYDPNATLLAVAGIAITADGTTAYTANNGNPGSVSIIDIATNAVTGTVVDGSSTFNQPFGIAISGNYAYVTNQQNNSVSVIDINPLSASFNHVVGSVSVGPWPNGIAISGTKAYVTNTDLHQTGNSSVSVLNISDPLNIPAATLVVDSGSTFVNPYGIAISGDYAYVTNCYNSSPGTGSVSIVHLTNNTVVGTVSNLGSTFNQPNGIVIAGTHAYVINSSGNSVSIVDISTPVSSFVTGVATNASTVNSPYFIGIAPNGNIAYIANIGNNSISILDTDSTSTSYNQVTGTVINYGFYSPQAVAITPNGKTAYVLNNYGGANLLGFVAIVDVATNTFVGAVLDPSNTFNDPNAIAITPNGQYAYVTNYNGNSISVIDIATKTVIAYISGLFSNPNAIAITPNGQYAYVTNYSVDFVTVIDLATNSVTHGIVDGSFVNSIAIAITPDGSTAYVVNFGNNIVSSINIATLDVTPVADPNATLLNPNAIAITPNGSTAYVLNSSGNSVSIIDLLAGTNYNTVIGIVTDFGSINGPVGIAIIPNDSLMYITNTGNNVVSIVDLATNKVTGTIVDTSISGPNAVAFTPNSNTAYVTNDNNNEVSIIFVQASVQAPGTISVQPIINRFLTRTQLINIIKWTVPTSGPQAESYSIYKDAALTDLIITVSADHPLEYFDYNVKPNLINSYYIVSNLDGFSSLPISNIVTPLG